MQKKMVALAVAGALGAPALAMAQAGTSTVQIFGTVYVEYDWMRQGRGGAADATGNIARRVNIDMLQNPGSELGFKGEEQLGGGLSAWFQCASTMNFLNEGQGTTTGILCSRNSALGLKGSWGNLYVGRWDTPFKRTSGPTQPGSNQTGMWGGSFLMYGGSTSTIETSSRATFQRRQGDMWFYDSPVFGGFQVLAGVSVPNGLATATGAALAGTGATTGVTSGKPRVYSIGAQYSAGPLYISGAYELHKEFSAVGGEMDDKGWHVGATYRLGPVLFGGAYSRQKFEMSGGSAGAAALGGAAAATGGGSSTATYPAWNFGVDWNIAGPHSLRANYTQALRARGNATDLIGPAVGGTFATTNTGVAGTYRPAPCLGAGATAATAGAASGCGGTGAKLFQVRYVYAFSKRTEFNFGGAYLKNDRNAAYSLGGLSSPQIGEKQRGLGIAMKHTF